MSEMYPNHDDLGQRLRAHYQQHLAPPPAPGQIWQLVAEGLRVYAQGDQAMTSTSTPASDNHWVKSREHRPSHIPSGFVSLSAVVLMALVATLLFAFHQAPASTEIANPLLLTNNASEMTGISMPAPNDGWAVGYYRRFKPGTAIPTTTDHPSVATFPEQPLMLHYDGTNWHVEDLSALLADTRSVNTTLNSVSFSSPNDGWAVGTTDGNIHSVVLHYDGKRWSRVNIDPQLEPNIVQMLAPDSGWMLTLNPADATNNAVLHYDGNQWTRQSLPSVVTSLENISMVSSTDGWATATQMDHGRSSGVILRYHNGTWSVQHTFPFTNQDDTWVGSIAMASVDEGWVQYVTVTTKQGDASHFLQHYHNGQWTRVADPLAAKTPFKNPYLPLLLRLHDANAVWLLESSISASAVTSMTLAHYDGRKWQQITGPTIQGSHQSGLSDLVVLSLNETWAVGSKLVQNASGAYIPRGLLFHYLNGVWSVYPQ